MNTLDLRFSTGDDGGVGIRPPSVLQLSITPFDQNDGWGDVHTVLPPEQVIPNKPTIRWICADPWGVTLPQAPPWVPGCNTTPREMVMSYFLPKYKQFGVQEIDKILTGHALRGLTHFLFDRPTWDQAGFSVQDAMDLIDYVQSWGFFTPVWLTGSSDDRAGGWSKVQPLIEPTLRALASRSARAEKTFVMPGEEMNNGAPPGPDGVDQWIAKTCEIANPSGIDVWLHFTSWYPGYPVDPPGTDPDQQMVEWIRQWIGRVVGLCWQGDPDASAGLLGAKLWDARRFWGRADPSFLVSAFELRGEAQLEGRCDETKGARTGWEMVCCTRDDTNLPAVAGAQAARYPDGRPLFA